MKQIPFIGFTSNHPKPLVYEVLKKIAAKSGYELTDESVVIPNNAIHLAIDNYKEFWSYYEKNYLPKLQNYKNSDFFIVSTYSTFVPFALRLIPLLRKINPNAKIIFGGWGPSMEYDEILDFYENSKATETERPDTIVFGPAIYLNRILNSENLDEIPNIIYWKENKPVKTKKEVSTKIETAWAKETDSVIAYRTMRGCRPNLEKGCTFCCPTSIEAYCRVPVKEVIQDLKEIFKDNKIHSINFLDNSFTSDKTWLMEFTKEFYKNFPDKKYFCSLRTDSIANDEELAKALSLNCEAVFVGIESPIDRICKYLRKGQTREILEKALEKLRKYNIGIRESYMLFTPISTLDEIKETIKFIQKELNSETASIGIFLETVPFRNTDLFKDLNETQIIWNSKEIFSNNGKIYSYTSPVGIKPLDEKVELALNTSKEMFQIAGYDGTQISWDPNTEKKEFDKILNIYLEALDKISKG